MSPKAFLRLYPPLLSPFRLFFVLPGSRPSLFCLSFLPLLAVPPGGGAHTTGGLLRFSAAPPRPRLLPSLSSSLPPSLYMYSLQFCLSREQSTVHTLLYSWAPEMDITLYAAPLQVQEGFGQRALSS